MMIKKIIKYLEVAKVSYRSGITYISESLGIGLLSMFRVWVLIQLYQLAFKVAGTSTIGGLDLTQTIWVLSLTQSFFISNRIRVLMKDMQDEVQSGAVAYNLTKPYSYILYHLFTNFGVIGSNLLFALVFSSAAVLIVIGPFDINILGIVAGVVLIVFGYLLNNLFGIMLGMSSFWVEDISAFRWLYDKIQSILGGVFIPLTILPIWFKDIIEFLPFSQMFYNPSFIIVNFETDLFLKFLTIQIVWIIFLGLAVNFMYQRAVKVVAINGG